MYFLFEKLAGWSREIAVNPPHTRLHLSSGATVNLSEVNSQRLSPHPLADADARTPRLPVPSAQHSGNGLQPPLSMPAAPAGSNHINAGLRRPRRESAHRAPGHRSHGGRFDPPARRTALPLRPALRGVQPSLGGVAAAAGILCRRLKAASQLRNLLVLPRSETQTILARPSRCTEREQLVT